MNPYALCLLLCALCCTAFLCAPCRADAERIVVVEDGDVLTRALRTSLSSWRVQVSHVPVASAQAFDDVLASELAAREGASAVVWLEGQSQHATLHVLVTQPKQSLVRASEDAWPLDAPAAAALALSVKAALRNTPLASLEEPKPQAVLSPVQTLPSAPTPPTSSRRGAPLFRLELSAGVGSRLAYETAARPLFAASVSVFEPWLTKTRLGLFVEARLMLAAQVSERELSADFSARTLAAGARLRMPLLDRLHAEGALHAGVLQTQLEGRARAGTERFDVTRVNPLLGGSFGVEVALTPHLSLLPRLYADALLRNQRYFGSGSEVQLHSRRWSLGGLLGLGWRLP